MSTDTAGQVLGQMEGAQVAAGRTFVDGRREGQHGIARFGTEVIARLRTPVSRLHGPQNALSPLDVLNIHRLALGLKDVVFSPGFHCGPTRARQLLVLHDLIQLKDPVERSRAKALYYEVLVRPAVKRTGRVLTVSATARREVQEWVGPHVRVIDVGNGCSDVFFNGERKERRPKLLYVGNLKPHKNAGVVFAALSQIPEGTLTVVTSDVEDARRLARIHQVEARVTVQSGVSDANLADMYASASALILPSLSEGFGLPAAEALAGNCPVVHWSGCDSVAEIVQSDGLAVHDPADVGEWTAALEAALRNDLRANSSARIRASYSWAAVSARVDQELSDLQAE